MTATLATATVLGIDIGRIVFALGALMSVEWVRAAPTHSTTHGIPKLDGPDRGWRIGGSRILSANWMVTASVGARMC